MENYKKSIKKTNQDQKSLQKYPDSYFMDLKKNSYIIVILKFKNFIY